jgi:hypothetical protein
MAVKATGETSVGDSDVGSAAVVDTEPVSVSVSGAGGVSVVSAAGGVSSVGDSGGGSSQVTAGGPT